jgi:hypothetical protein
VIPIGKTNPDWNRIKGEYVAGGISQRDLAEKYGIPFGTMQKRAVREKWTEERTEAGDKVVEKVIQKTAEKTADNATLAADIKRKGLLLLDRLFDEFDSVTSTEHRDYKGRNVTDIKRLRDLTAAYKDLTDDMAKPEESESPILRSLCKMMQEKRNG